MKPSMTKNGSSSSRRRHHKTDKKCAVRNMTIAVALCVLCTLVGVQVQQRVLSNVSASSASSSTATATATIKKDLSLHTDNLYLDIQRDLDVSKTELHGKRVATKTAFDSNQPLIVLSLPHHADLVWPRYLECGGILPHEVANYWTHYQPNQPRRQPMGKCMQHNVQEMSNSSAGITQIHQNCARAKHKVYLNLQYLQAPRRTGPKSKQHGPGCFDPVLYPGSLQALYKTFPNATIVNAQVQDIRTYFKSMMTAHELFPKWDQWCNTNSNSNSNSNSNRNINSNHPHLFPWTRDVYSWEARTQFYHDYQNRLETFVQRHAPTWKYVEVILDHSSNGGTAELLEHRLGIDAQCWMDSVQGTLPLVSSIPPSSKTKFTAAITSTTTTATTTIDEEEIEDEMSFDGEEGVLDLEDNFYDLEDDDHAYNLEDDGFDDTSFGIATSTTQSLPRPNDLHFPILVTSLPKSGTMTIAEYFKCGLGEWAVAHQWTAPSNPHKYPLNSTFNKAVPIGKCMFDNIQSNTASILHDCGHARVWSDIGYLRSPRKTGSSSSISSSSGACYYPSLSDTELERFYHAYPMGTLLAVVRNSTSWYKSAKSWNDLTGRWSRNPECRKMGFPPPGSSQATWEQFYESHTQQVRDFAQTHPSLTYLEIELSSSATTKNILQDLFGFHPTCWGLITNSNANGANKAVQTARTSAKTTPKGAKPATLSKASSKASSGATTATPKKTFGTPKVVAYFHDDISGNPALATQKYKEMRASVETPATTAATSPGTPKNSSWPKS